MECSIYVPLGNKTTKTLPTEEHQQSTLCGCSGASNVSPLFTAVHWSHIANTRRWLTTSRPDPAAPNGTAAPEARRRGGGKGAPGLTVCQGKSKSMCVRVHVCVGWDFIRSNTWNYWHMDWGLEILWHKDFICNGICFHRIWLFSG